MRLRAATDGIDQPKIKAFVMALTNIQSAATQQVVWRTVLTADSTREGWLSSFCGAKRRRDEGLSTSTFPTRVMALLTSIIACVGKTEMDRPSAIETKQRSLCAARRLLPRARISDDETWHDLNQEGVLQCRLLGCEVFSIVTSS